MNIDVTAIPYNQIVWWGLAILGAILAVILIRFFWKHLLKYLFQGCLFLLAILALLALLHYFKVF
jgi:hypothetical protein